MANSPLDGSFEYAKKKFKPKWILTIIALVGTAVGGGVFATAISLNSGGTVEFGQGVGTLVACDNNIVVIPISEFDGTSFMLTSVALSQFDSIACDGKTIIVKALSTDATPTVVAEESTVFPSVNENDEVTFTFDPSPAASLVGTITVESQD